MYLPAADRDETVSPGADFYRYANGGWIDVNPIPPGYGAWGAFEEIDRRNERVLRDVLPRLADQPGTDLERMLGDYYAVAMDVDGVEAAGLSAVQDLLDAAAAVQGLDDLLGLLPRLHRAGVSVPFAIGVTPDHDDATRYLLWIVQGGLGLPDRESYVAADERGEQIRDAYVAHVAAQLRNLGTPEAEAVRLADGVMALETRMAGTHLRAEEARNPDLTLNKRAVADLGEVAPGLDLPRYLASVGAGAATHVNVQSPGALAGLAGIVSDTAPDVLRAYLRFHIVRDFADSLPQAFDDESFAFYGRMIRGQQEQHERVKRVIGAMTTDMGEALSQAYVAVAFPAEAKQRALDLVDAVVQEMGHSLRTRSWMTDETRERGLTKLAAIRVKIGYPDTWRSWEGLQVDRRGYAHNRRAASEFDVDRQLARLTRSVDQAEWEMPPHMVNAYYHPTRNEIVFPAGILQPPLFDADADDAVNFGGIGAVIGHEITHGFDDQGRRFDADGTFRDWWTDEDGQRFQQLAGRLVEQFDGYEVVDGLHVNGQLTLGENIADLGGVALAQRALARVAVDASPVDGLTPAQRFFLANATLWRARVSDELQRTLVQMDPHSPRHLRVRGPLSNLDAFATAFGLGDDAPMMRPASDRIEIW